MRTLLCVTALLMVLAGCDLANSEGDVVRDLYTADPGDYGLLESDGETISGVGIIEFIDIEGGFYRMSVQGQSERYVLEGIPGAYQEEGLRVRYRLLVVDDRASLCQCGPVACVLELEALDG